MTQGIREIGKGRDDPKERQDAMDMPNSDRSSADFTVDEIYNDWQSDVTDRLLSRVHGEFEMGADYVAPVSRDELVRLLERHTDAALPIELRTVLQDELSGRRKKKRGPKANNNLVEQIQLTLLPSVYQRGLQKGASLRSWMKERETRRRRNARAYDIPTARTIACRHVRRWLPRYRNMTDAALSNLISTLRKPSQGRILKRAVKRI